MTNETGFGGRFADVSGNGTENVTTPFCGQVYQQDNIHDDSVTRIIPSVWLVLGIILMVNTVARCAHMQYTSVASSIMPRGCVLFVACEVSCVEITLGQCQQCLLYISNTWGLVHVCVASSSSYVAHTVHIQLHLSTVRFSDHMRY